MEIEKIEEREVQEYSTQVEFIVGKAEGLEIHTEEDLVKAGDILSDIKKVEKAVSERKNSITRPLMTALAGARNLFKPLEAGYGSAKKIVSDKMVAYTVAEEERVAKEQARIEARVEKGTMREDTAIQKLEDVGDAPKSVDSSRTKTTFVTRTKMRIVDESLIPREYMTPDTRKITDAVLRNGEVIPGVETYKEKSISSKSK